MRVALLKWSKEGTTSKRSEEGTPFNGILPESQGQKLALTVWLVPGVNAEEGGVGWHVLLVLLPRPRDTPVRVRVVLSEWSKEGTTSNVLRTFT